MISSSSKRCVSRRSAFMFHHLSEARAPLVHRACPACAAHPCRHRFAKDGYAYVQCEACGLVYINPIPAYQALEQAYEELSEEYFLADRRRAVDTYAQRHARE